jgi:spore germination protein GerM
MPPWAWFAIGAVVVLVGVGVPLLFLGGDDDTADTTTTALIGSTTTSVGDTTTTAGDATTTSTPTDTTVVTTTTPVDTTGATTTTGADTTTTATPPGEGVAVAKVYFLAETEESNTEGPHLAAVARPLLGSGGSADLLPVVLTALLEGPLVDDPPLAGLSSGIPENVELLGVTVDGGVAAVDLAPAFAEGGGTFAMMSRLAQVVFTATQFPNVDAVTFLIDGEPVDVFSSEGIVLDGPQTREDYYDAVLPLVFLDSPAAGQSIATPLELVGVANAFEANVLYEVVAGDDVVADGFTTATCGTGCWGDFTVEVEFPIETQGEGFVTVFETSAEDGRRVNIQSYPVTILPTG